MSRAIQIKVYSYEELSPEAQKTAREQWEQDDREAGSEHACEIVNEDFAQAVGEAGYPTDDIQWSLSYCQGDGMAFYGNEHVDSKMLERLVMERWKPSVDGIDVTEVQRLVEISALEFSFSITPNSFGNSYAHFNTMEVEVDLRNYSVDTINDIALEMLRKSLEDFIDEDMRTLSKKLADQGYEVFDGYYEASEIADTLIANEYEFTKDGSFWCHDNWAEKSNGQS